MDQAPIVTEYRVIRTANAVGFTTNFFSLLISPHLGAGVVQAPAPITKEVQHVTLLYYRYRISSRLPKTNFLLFQQLRQGDFFGGQASAGVREENDAFGGSHSVAYWVTARHQRGPARRADRGGDIELGPFLPFRRHPSPAYR